MSYQPVVPFVGTSGWQFLKRTQEAQLAAFKASAPVTRATAYFEQKIASVRTADDLVSDRQLLTVALGAFGLEADIDSRFFIRKVLEGGTTDEGALANRLADKRYLSLADAFGFGDVPGGKTRAPGFAARVLAQYEDRQFEAAIGLSNPDLRLAMGLQRDLPELASRSNTANGLWFAVMASPPLRTVFERALGLPKSMGALDIDRQLAIFKGRADARLGSSDLRQLATPDRLAEVTRKFLVSADISAQSGGTGASAALTLLATASRWRV